MSAVEAARAAVAVVARWVQQQVCAHHWHTPTTGRWRAVCCWCGQTSMARRLRDERRTCCGTGAAA